MSAGLLLGLLAGFANPASQQEAMPSIPVIAQAHDRCMTTVAVRSSRTSSNDAEIFAEARRSCAHLDEQLTAAIRKQLPPATAAEILAKLAAQSEPNFMSMLSKIRSGRARNQNSTQGAPAPRTNVAPVDPARCDIRPQWVDRARAAEDLASQARRGDREAMFQLGLRHELGEGVAIDLKKARKYYSRAAAASPDRTYVYSPPVGSERQGRVIAVSTPPRSFPHPTAGLRLSCLHAAGR